MWGWCLSPQPTHLVLMTLQKKSWKWSTLPLQSKVGQGHQKSLSFSNHRKLPFYIQPCWTQLVPPQVWGSHSQIVNLLALIPQTTRPLSSSDEWWWPESRCLFYIHDCLSGLRFQSATFPHLLLSTIAASSTPNFKQWMHSLLSTEEASHLPTQVSTHDRYRNHPSILQQLELSTSPSP